MYEQKHHIAQNILLGGIELIISMIHVEYSESQGPSWR